MRRRVMAAWMAGLILLGCALVIAANNSVEGRWKVVTDTPDGGPTEWITIFKIQDGKLVGTAEGDPGHFEFKNLKMKGAILSGELVVEGDKYTFEVTVAGDKFEGKWKLNSLSGSIKGARDGRDSRRSPSADERRKRPRRSPIEIAAAAPAR